MSTRATRASGTTATIGTPGRWAAAATAPAGVRPAATSTETSSSLAASAAAAIASEMCALDPAPPPAGPPARAGGALASAAAAIASAARAAKTGYAPIAVSPESITASAPSRTALATSLASARVGRDAVSIDSSIWVATITGWPSDRATATRRFWTIGTSSNGSSRPRSPRAIITPSATAAIASNPSTAGRVSILATIAGPSGPRTARRSSTSRGVRTNDWPSRSMPISTARRASSRSWSPRAGSDSRSAGTFTPTRDRRVPPRSTVVTHRPSLDGGHDELDDAVGQLDVVPGPEVVGEPRVGGDGAGGVTLVGGVRAAEEPERRPRLDGRRAAGERAEPDLRPRQVGEDRDLPTGRAGRVPDGRDACRVLGRRAMGEVEARDRHPGVEELGEPALARGTDRADQLGRRASVHQ